MYYVRFNVTDALFLRQFNKFSEMTTWVQDCLFKNTVGLDLRIKVVKDGEMAFLVIVIGVSSFDKLKVIDEHFKPDTKLWADASSTFDREFDELGFIQSDAHFAFMSLHELRLILEDEKTKTDIVGAVQKLFSTINDHRNQFTKAHKELFFESVATVTIARECAVQCGMNRGKFPNFYQDPRLIEGIQKAERSVVPMNFTDIIQRCNTQRRKVEEALSLAAKTE